MNKTPGYNRRIGIAFTSNKAGQRIAYRWCVGAARWIRMAIDEAELLIASETADRIEYVR